MFFFDAIEAGENPLAQFGQQEGVVGLGLECRQDCPLYLSVPSAHGSSTLF
jgi:hypothetical protein